MSFRNRVIKDMESIRVIFETHGLEKGIEYLNTIIKNYVSEKRHQPSLVDAPPTALP